MLFFSSFDFSARLINESHSQFIIRFFWLFMCRLFDASRCCVHGADGLCSDRICFILLCFHSSNVEIINKEVASFDYSQHNVHRSCYVSDTMKLNESAENSPQKYIMKKALCNAFFFSFSAFFSLCLSRPLSCSHTILYAVYPLRTFCTVCSQF